MSNQPCLLITADTHADGSHAQYREYLEPVWSEKFDEWRGGYRNPAQEHYSAKKMKNWDLAIHSEDQNSQGVVAEVVFPNTVPPFFRKSIVTAPPPGPEDFESCLAGIRAHNRWLADFCAEDPLRRAGVGLILPNDLDEAIRDIGFIARAGLRRRGLLIFCRAGSQPALFMNCLLRSPIAAKTLGVLLPRARRAVKHACAHSSPRHHAFSLLSTPSLRPFMNNAG